MNAQTKVSAKGQIVLPKDVRDRLNWPQGTELEVIDGPAGVLLRPSRSKKTGPTFDESVERMQAIFAYDGPPSSDDDWKESIDRMFREGKDVTI